jgi:hypothetical protein
VIQRALQKAPEQRFQSAVEFHEAFARCLAGLPLTTMYGSAAATELIATPSRPMPTGGFPGTLTTTPPLPPAYSGAIPTVTTPTRGTPPSGQYPATNAAADAPTVVSSSGALAQPVPPVPPASPATAPAAAKPAAKATANKNKMLLVGGAAAVLLIAIVVAAMLMRSGDAPPPPPPPTAELVPPPPTEPPPPPVAPPVDPAVGAAGTVPPPPDPATATPPPPPAGASVGRGTPPPVSGSTTPPPGSTAPPVTPATTAPIGRGGDPAAADPAAGRKPAPPGPDEPSTFDSVKFVTVTGRRVSDEDVNVTFGGGQLAVVPREGGAPTKTLPYRRILRATYIRSDNPRWDPALPAPTEKFDAGGIFNRDRHWLFLQTKDDYVILRLEGDGWLTVLQTFESRTGLKIDRPEK